MGFGSRYEGEGSFAEAEASIDRVRREREERICKLREPPPAQVLDWEWAVAWTAEHLPGEAPVWVLRAAWRLSAGGQHITPEAVLGRLERRGLDRQSAEGAA